MQYFIKPLIWSNIFDYVSAMISVALSTKSFHNCDTTPSECVSAAHYTMGFSIRARVSRKSIGSVQNSYDVIVAHYNAVIMGAMASGITSLPIVYATIKSGADERKHQSSSSLTFWRGIHRWPVNSQHKGPVSRKMFSFDDVIMTTSYMIQPMSWCMYLHNFIWPLNVITAILIEKMWSKVVPKMGPTGVTLETIL